MIYYRSKRVSFSLAFALVVMALTFFFHPFPLSKATERDRWEGQMEEKINQGEKRDAEVLQKIDTINKKIDAFCDTITEKVHQTQLDMLRTSGAYGAGAGGIFYGIGELLKLALRKRKR